FNVRSIESADRMRYELFVREITGEYCARIKRVADVKHTRPFRCHKSGMDAFMYRSINLRRLVHDDENVAGLGVNALNRTGVVRRKPKDIPTGAKPDFRLQKLGAKRYPGLFFERMDNRPHVGSNLAEGARRG